MYIHFKPVDKPGPARAPALSLERNSGGVAAWIKVERTPVGKHMQIGCMR